MVYTRDVACLRKSVGLFAALLILSTPLMACTLPGEEMSKAEQECCLQMGDQCGNSQMSDGHTCCTKTPRVNQDQLKTTSKHLSAAPELVAQGAFCMTSLIATGILPRPLSLPDDSPSPPGSVTILRI